MVDGMTVIGFPTVIASWYSLFAQLWKPSPSLPNLSGLQRVQTILFVGLLAAAIHVILVEGGQKFLLRKNYHAGGGTSLPHGWTAILLSMTMTVPLALAPVLYGQLSHSQIVQTGHLFASCLVVITGVVGHLALYGIAGFRGFKPIIFPLNMKSGPVRPLVMEAVFAVVHFCSIVLVYRSSLLINLQQPIANIAIPTIKVAALWWLSVALYFLLTYPETVTDKRTVERRGVVNGYLLILTLQVGMLM